jgi:D-alanyl-lipoteichoic acid acyltransferase DltB (MBOAT superfamily)
MAFTQMNFLMFITLVVLVYFIVPLRTRWVVLLLGSLTFYYLNSGYLLLVLLASIVFTFVIGIVIQNINDKGKAQLSNLGKEASRAEKQTLKLATKKRARLVVTLGICVNLGALLYLKYFNFFVDISNGTLGTSVPIRKIVLPLGISFYTLQAIAYIVDVYRGKVTADRHLAKFALFLSYFPQIVQGPIPRYKQLASQLYEGHEFDYRRLCHGAQLILWGFFLKLVIADRLAVPVNTLFVDWKLYHGLLMFVSAVFYGLQVYADFSGGVNIARGFSQIVGIELEQNFRQPYNSRSIEEFWRRWHITLGAWMKDYVFYPLSLSKLFVEIGRKSRNILGNYAGKRLPPIMAMFIVYFLVGFWHGPDWKFIVYGIWNGIFITLGILLGEQYTRLATKLGFDQQSMGWRTFQIVRTFIICSFGRFFSRGESLEAAFGMINQFFHGWYDITWLFDGTLTSLGLERPDWLVLACAIAVLFWIDSLHERGISIRNTIDEQHVVFRWFVYCIAFLAVVIFGVWGSSYDASAFIYGQL